uniref:Uncharacterized protein n=1 Tax=Arundo donax TaxID=35708 RepID=A0A0A9AH18_ARUDO
MPNLRRLEIEATATLLKWDGCTPAGMENLLGLKEICVSMVYGQGMESERITAECTFRNIAQAHPCRPTVTIV